MCQSAFSRNLPWKTVAVFFLSLDGNTVVWSSKFLLIPHLLDLWFLLLGLQPLLIGQLWCCKDITSEHPSPSDKFISEILWNRDIQRQFRIKKNMLIRDSCSYRHIFLDWINVGWWEKEKLALTRSSLPKMWPEELQELFGDPIFRGIIIN